MPLLIRNGTGESHEATLNLITKLPDGWSETSRPSRFIIEAGDVYPVQVSIKTPTQPADDWREIRYAVEVKGRESSTAVLRAQLRPGTIPQ